MEKIKIKQMILTLVLIILSVNLYHGMYLSFCLVNIAAILVYKFIEQLESYSQDGNTKDNKGVLNPMDEPLDSSKKTVEINDKRDNPPVEPVGHQPQKTGYFAIDFFAEIIKEVDEKLNLSLIHI